MSKARFRALQKSWSAFDRSTAFMCANRGEAFDAERCTELWASHNALIDSPAMQEIGA